MIAPIGEAFWFRGVSWSRFMYGLKPVHTSPHLPSDSFEIEFFRSLFSR
jgi:hypothetical protein